MTNLASETFKSNALASLVLIQKHTEEPDNSLEAYEAWDKINAKNSFTINEVKDLTAQIFRLFNSTANAKSLSLFNYFDDLQRRFEQASKQKQIPNQVVKSTFMQRREAPYTPIYYSHRAQRKNLHDSIDDTTRSHCYNEGQRFASTLIGVAVLSDNIEETFKTTLSRSAFEQLLKKESPYREFLEGGLKLYDDFASSAPNSTPKHKA